jgi:excisionase family DNA binding protein
MPPNRDYAPLETVYYSTRQAAFVLDLSVWSVLAMVRDGRLTGTRMPGGGYLLQREEIDQLAAQRAARFSAHQTQRDAVALVKQRRL